MDRSKDTGRRYSARRFAVGAMSCPACQRRLDEPADRCPHCGFTGADCLAMFPFAAPALDDVVDPGNLLDRQAVSAVKGALGRLRRRFRQVRWCLCLVELPPEVNLRLFGFWLLNSARPEDDDPEGPAWTVLLVVDTAGQAAAVTAGYALESFVADDSWMRSVTAMSLSWRRGDPGRALCEFLAACEHELEGGAWRAMRLLGAAGGGGA